MKAYFIVPIKEGEKEDPAGKMGLPKKFTNQATAETVCSLMNANRPVEHSGYKVEEREVE